MRCCTGTIDFLNVRVFYFYLTGCVADGVVSPWYWPRPRPSAFSPRAPWVPITSGLRPKHRRRTRRAEGWKQAEPQDHLVRGAWWEIFNNPELNALEEQVNISNQNVAAAEAQFRQALALVQVARAGYFPTVTAGASATRALRSDNAGVGNPSTSGTTINDYLAPLTASWAIDVWGRVRRLVEAGTASAQASAALLESVRLLTQAQVAQDYFQLRTLDAQKKLLDETTIAYQTSLKLTQNRYASGIASRADVLQAETLLKSTQAQAIDIGVQRAQLEHAIAVLLGKPASLFSIPVVPLGALPPAIPVGVPSELLERRPDIAAAERNMAAANAQIGVARQPITQP